MIIQKLIYEPFTNMLFFVTNILLNTISVLFQITFISLTILFIFFLLASILFYAFLKKMYKINFKTFKKGNIDVFISSKKWKKS